MLKTSYRFLLLLAILCSGSRLASAQSQEAIRLNNEGVQRLNRNDYAGAVDMLNHAISLSPNIAGFYTSRANALTGLGKQSEAIADCDRSLRLRPRDAATYAARAMAYLKLQQYQKALDDSNRALEITPGNADFLNNRGVIFSRLKKYEQAIADYTESLELDKTNPLTFGNRATAYMNSKKFKQALRDVNKALELVPNGKAYIDLRAAIYFASKQYSLVAADVTRLLAQDPNNVDYLYSRGMAFLSDHQLQAAIVDFKRALELEPGKKFIERSLARAESQLQAQESNKIPTSTSVTRDIQVDEILLRGSVQEVDAKTGLLIVNVFSFTLPSGKSANLTKPKTKVIRYTAQTAILKLTSPQASEVRAARIEDIHTGQHIAVIGRDSGAGRELNARRIAIEGN